MKQFFLIPTCALVAAVTVTSCQREEKSCVELATELTTILKKVNDYESAEAAAPAVKVYMERLSAALGRPVAHGGSALYKSESGALKSALEDLAREIARVRASYPEAVEAKSSASTGEQAAPTEESSLAALTQNLTARIQGNCALAFKKYAAKTISDEEKDQLVAYSKNLLKQQAETQAGMAEIAALEKLVKSAADEDSEEEEESEEEEDSEESGSIAESEEVDASDAASLEAYLKKCKKEQEEKASAAYRAKAEAVLAAVQKEHHDALIKSASKLINTMVSFSAQEESEIPNGFVTTVKYKVSNEDDSSKIARINRINELVTVMNVENLLQLKGVTPVRAAEIIYSVAEYLDNNGISIETDDSLLQHLGANLSAGEAEILGQIKTSCAASSLAQGNVYLNTFTANASSGATYTPTENENVNELKQIESGEPIAFAECFGSVALQEAFSAFISLGNEDASAKPVIQTKVWAFDGEDAAQKAPEVDWNAVDAARKAVAPAEEVVATPAVDGTAEETPAADEEEPAADEETPAADEEEPAADEEEPAADEEEPAADEEEPAADEEEPAADEEEPAADEEEPAADEEEPAADEEEPAADEEEPAADEEEPAADEEEPAADEEEPATDEEEPAADEEDESEEEDVDFGDIEI